MGDDDESTDGNHADAESSAETPVAAVPLSLDARLDLVSNRERRCLLNHLRAADDGASTYEEATGHIMETLASERGEQPNHNTVKASLQHVHLPKLTDAGVVEFDVRSQEIRYHSNDRLERLLDEIAAFEG